jgi:hypothetical protein
MAATSDQTAGAAAGAGRCPTCGAAMAPDQRYCLSCGARRGAARVAPAGSQPVPADTAVVSAQRPADVSPLAAVIGIALLGGMLLIGVLIGRSGSDDNSTPAPVVTVAPGTTTPGASTTTPGTTPGDSTTAPATPSGVVATDWPTDAQGFTIQLSTVPKEGATQELVDAAKQTATGKGAKDVGSLDSDLYPSLTPGNYVIYSGIYTDRNQATKALGKLADNFPDATVVEVNSGGKDAGAQAIEPGASTGDKQ